MNVVKKHSYAALISSDIQLTLKSPSPRGMNPDLEQSVQASQGDVRDI